MFTLLAIVLLVVLVAGLICMVNELVSGNPFAWVWFAMGGFESLAGLIALLLQAIVEGISE